MQKSRCDIQKKVKSDKIHAVPVHRAFATKPSNCIILVLANQLRLTSTAGTIAAHSLPGLKYSNLYDVEKWE